MTLTSGTLALATVRVPWPNPLTSTVGFSTHSLHLTFEVASSTLTAPAPNTDLASSVVCVAETFLHEEVIPREGASFLDSIHSEFPGALNEGVVPGGLNPFNVDNAEEHAGEHSSEMEPGGISLFATLIERLLARFEFDANDVRITLVHANNAVVNLNLSEIKYNANTKQTQLTVEHIVGVNRSLTVNGVTLKMKDLRTNIVPMAEVVSPISSTFPSSPDAPRGLTSTGSSCPSSLDDDITLENSQTLPQRPSPTCSIDNSMYHSALPVVGEANEPATIPGCPGSVLSRDLCNSLFNPRDLVFSSGTAPITISAVTLPPSPTEEHIPLMRDKVTFSCQSGLFAFALRPWHIRGLLCLISTLSRNLPQSKPRPPNSGAIKTAAESIPFDIEGSLNFRGLILLLLPCQSRTLDEELQKYFLHPLASLSLSSGYLRLQIKGISMLLDLSAQSEHNSLAKATSVNYSQMSGTLSIHSLDIFGFRPCDNDNVSAFPILFADPYLPSQYPSQHFHPNGSDRALNHTLPDFDVLDWTDPVHQQKGASRLSYWRCKLKGQQNSRCPVSQTFPLSSQLQESSLVQNVTQHEQHFISVQFHDDVKRKGSPQFVVEGTVVPLHVFLDLGALLREDTITKFLDEASQGLVDFSKMTVPSAEDFGYHDRDEILPAISHPHEIFDRNRKDRQLDLVFEDLHLDRGAAYKSMPEDGLVQVR